MKEFDFTVVAKAVRMKCHCSVHMAYPEYKISKTPRGVTTHWDCCCDTQKNKVNALFGSETEKAGAEFLKNTLKEAFKGSKYIKIK